MVSEDSQEFGWLSVVHRLRDLRDLDDAVGGEVPPMAHQVEDPCELLEVASFRSPQRMFTKERDDYVAQVIEPLNAISEHILPMIVVSAVAIDLSATEETHQIVEDVATRCALCDGKLRSDLPSQRHRAASIDGCAEAAFSVYEPHDPSDRLEPFLLVFRTLRIFTAHP